MLKRLLSLVLAALIAVPAPALPAQAAPPSIERPVAHGAGDAGPALPRLAQRLSDTIPPLYMLGGDDKIAPVALWNAATDAFPSTVLTHSSTSLAMMFDSTGKLTYAPNNLLTYSQTWADPAWVKSAATVVGNLLTDDTSTGAHLITGTNVGISSGANVIFAVWASKNTKTQIALQLGADVAYFDLDAGTVISGAKGGIVDVGDGSYICFIKTVPSNNNTIIYLASGGTVSYTGTGSGSVYIYASRASAVTYETTPRTGDQVATASAAYYGPRIDYDPNTLAVKGLLIEPLAATNYCPYSSALSSWTANNATLTNNTGATLDPSGLNTASILNPTGGATASAFPVNFSASASTEYTGSVFVKSNGSNFGGFGFYDATNAVLYAAVFNLTTGANTFATAGVTALPSENIGNGWWRVSAKWTSAGSTAAITPVVYSWSTGGGGNATASDKLFLWGPQFEKNFEASSYIANPSTGTTTRAQDNVQFAGAAATALSSANFSAIVEGRIKTANASGVILIGGTSAFGVHLYSVSNTTARAYDGTRSQVYGDVTSGGAAWTAGSRAGVAASPAGTSLAMAGGTVGSYTNFATQSSGAALGRSVSSAANPGTLWVKSFGIYSQRLSDATLQTRTVVGASYAANDNGVRFAFANDNLPVHWRIAL